VDEVLAVGDLGFQKKCLGKMSDVAHEGRTVLFVSHNMSAILRLTQEAVVLDQGRLALLAPTREAVDFYLSQKVTGNGEYRWPAEQRAGNSVPFIPLALRICNRSGQTVVARGKIEAFRVRGLREGGALPGEFEVIHGSTVATNALLERKGARLAFIGQTLLQSVQPVHFSGSITGR
jgi:lipopolysaccharide transport system ATP-binding protein